MPLFGARRATDPADLDIQLGEAARRLNEGRVPAARRAYRHVVEDAKRLTAQHGPAVAPAHGTALLGLGDIAASLGEWAEALAVYRTAASLITPPGRVRRLLAEDVLRRNDLSPDGLRVLAGFLVTDAGPAESDPLTRHVEPLCWPPADAPTHAHGIAEALAGQVVAISVELGWAHLARGIALAALGRRDDALAELVEAERLEPDRAATPYQLGLLHEARGEPVEATAALRRSIAIDGERTASLIAVARVLVARADAEPEQAHLTEAVEHLRRAGRLAPRRADIWHRLGTLERRIDPATARSALAAAAELDPGNAGYQRDLADLLVDLDDPAAAIESLHRGLRADPADAGSAELLGRLATDTGRAAEGQPVLRAALRVDPGHRGARFQLGRSLLATGDPAGAVTVLAQLSDRTPAEGHLLGRAYARSGRLDAAVEELQRCLRDGGTAEIAFTLGCVHGRRGAWADAVTAFDRAHAVAAPVSAELEMFTGIAHHRSGDRDQARRHLDAAAEAAPDDPRVHRARGALAVDDGDWDAAAAAFERALAAAPDDPDARFGLGLVLEQRADPAAAAEEYRRGLAGRQGWRPAVLRLAAIEVDAGRPAAALQVLSDLEPGDDLDALRALASARAGEHGTAARLWTGLDPGGPDGPIARNVRLATDHLATAALAAHDYDTARRHWETCHATAPGGRYVVGLAEACLRLAAAAVSPDVDMPARRVARTHLDRAAGLVPDDQRVTYLRAVLPLADGDDRAAADLEPLAAAGDEHAAYHLALADAMAGNLDRAVERLDDPQRSWSQIGGARQILRASVDAHRGRYREAFDGFRAIVDGPVPDSTALPAGTPVFAGLTRCAAELGTLPEAVAALTPYAPTHSVARHWAGLAAAHVGDSAAAVRLLTPLVDPEMDGDPPAVRSALVDAHLVEAERHALVGEFSAAERAVSAAAAADPASPGVRAAGPLALEWRARALAEDGSAGKALALWEARLAHDPMDLVAIHHLAVLARRLLTENRREGERVPRRGVTDTLIACWAALLHSHAFWTGLAGRTGRTVDDAERDAARQRFSEELTRMLRDHAERNPDGGSAPADVEWGFEQRVAATVAEFEPDRRGVPAWRSGFACGRVMLARMATHPRGAALSEMLSAAALAAVDARLATLLGAIGRGRYLLDEGLLDAAVTELEKLPGEAPAALLGQALLAVGAARAEDSVWADSVAAFRRAADLGADLAPHAAVARQATLRRISQLNDSARESGDSNSSTHGRWEAVELMEAMHPLLPRDHGFDADLGASYAQLARQVNNDDDFEQAVVLLRKALALTPDDQNTRHFAKIALGNLAHQLLLDGDRSGIRRAFALLREAPAFAEGPREVGRLRAQAADVLFGAARSHADANRLDTAVTVLREALTYEDDSVSRRFLASLYNRLDRPGEAVSVLADGYARLPADPELASALATAVHNEAVRLADSRRFDEAIAAFHRALGISDSAVTRKMLAQTYALRGVDRVNAGDRRNGRADLERAVQLDPTDPTLYRALRTIPL